MGLKFLNSIVDTAKGSILSTLKGQALDAISCENMPSNILMMRKSTPDGHISHGSSIIVEPGQMAVIVSGGAVVDATAQEGVYKFEEGAPSFFAGDFGATFKDMWTRFTFGGSRPIKDSVYYINTREIMDNHFGTVKPVIYSDWEHAIMNPRRGALQPMMVHVRGFGSYTFKVDDPATFLREVAGTADIYEKEELCDQMRIEVTGAVQAILNKLSSEQYQIPVTQISGQAGLIKELMEKDVYDADIRRRGVKIASLVISDIELTEESVEKVDQYERADAYTQQTVMTDAYANALVGAANNANGSPAGFIGMGFANMAGANMFANPMMGGMQQQPMMNGQMQQPMMNGQMQQPMMNGQMQQPMMNGQMQQQPMMNGQMQQQSMMGGQMQQQPAMGGQAAPAGNTCPKCGAVSAGKFCAECGTQIGVPAKKFCSKCGAEVVGKFCAECGTQVQ